MPAMAIFPRPQSLRRPGQNVLRNETVFIGLPRGNVSSSSSSSSNPTPPVNPPETVTYVAPNGSDATGERGNPLQPFLTINAALAVSQDNDVILLAPGTYPPVTVPPTLSIISIKGMGTQNQAVLQAPTGTSPLTWTPIPGFRVLILDSLTLRSNNPVNPAFLVDGNHNAQADAVLILNQVLLEGAPGYAQYLYLIRGERSQGDLTLYNNHSGEFHQHYGTTLNLQVNEPVPPQIAPLQPMSFYESSWVEAFLAGDFNFYGDKDTEISQIFAPSFTTPMVENAVLEFHGTSTEIQGAFKSTPNENQVDVSFATIGLLAFQHLESPGQSTINARGANIDEVALLVNVIASLTLDTRGGSLRKTSGFSSIFTRWIRDGGSARVELNQGPNQFDYITFVANGGPMPGASFGITPKVRYTVTPEFPTASPSESVWIPLSSQDGVLLVNDFVGVPVTVQINYQLEPEP